MNQDLIAPCGMNCNLCVAHLRDNNSCPGCNKPTLKSCLNCIMRNCKERKGRFCFDCENFPCERLKHLDKRYREKYEMSEIENLEMIRDKGMEYFLAQEKNKWINSEGIYCMHNRKRYSKKLA